MEPTPETVAPENKENNQESPKKGGKKGDRPPKGENQKSDKKGPRRNENRPQRMTNKQLYEKWEAEITITLETEIPNLGTEKLKEPDNDALKAALKPITVDIDAKKAYIEKLKEDRKKAIADDKKARATESGNFQELVQQSKVVKDEIKAIEAEKDKEQKEIDERVGEKENLIKRIPGKKLISAGLCETQIEELTHRLKNENMTGQQERGLLAELKQLEEAKPMITRIKTIEEEIKKYQVTKKEIQKRFKASIDERKAIQERITELKKQKEGDQQEGGEKKEVDKKDRPKHPITIKIDGIQDEITGLYDKKGALKKAHDDAYTAWREQQELETKIKWMKRQRNKLMDQKRKDDAILAEKEEEERIQKEKDEIIRIYGKPKKYQPQIDICDNLIAFCTALKPTTAVFQKPAAPTETAQAPMSDVKGERLEVHVQKDEYKGLLPGQGGKKKRNKKNKPKAEGSEAVDSKLTLTAETFTYFDNIKVPPPGVASELEQALKDLNEKRTYFIKLSDDLNEGVQRDEPDLPKLPADEEEEGDENAVKEKKQPKGKKVKVDDEEAFPSL